MANKSVDVILGGSHAPRGKLAVKDFLAIARNAAMVAAIAAVSVIIAALNNVDPEDANSVLILIAVPVLEAVRRWLAEDNGGE